MKVEMKNFQSLNKGNGKSYFDSNTEQELKVGSNFQEINYDY